MFKQILGFNWISNQLCFILIYFNLKNTWFVVDKPWWYNIKWYLNIACLVGIIWLGYSYKINRCLTCKILSNFNLLWLLSPRFLVIVMLFLKSRPFLLKSILNCISDVDSNLPNNSVILLFEKKDQLLFADSFVMMI